MREALEVGYGDRRPAFDLCWRMSDASFNLPNAPTMDATAILDRAIPDRREVVAAYLAIHARFPSRCRRTRGAEAGGLRRSWRSPCTARRADSCSSRPTILFRRVSFGERSATRSPPAFSTEASPRPAESRIRLAIDRITRSGSHRARSTSAPHCARRPPARILRVADPGRKSGAARALHVALGGANERTSLAIGSRVEDRRSAWGYPAKRYARIRIGAVRRNFAELVPEMVSLTLFYQRPVGQARAEGSIEIINVSSESVP